MGSPNSSIGLSGGRTWWAHFELTRINIAPTILPKKIKDLRLIRPRGHLPKSGYDDDLSRGALPASP